MTFEQAIDYKYKHVITPIRVRRPSELKLQFIYRPTFCYDFVIFADTMLSCVVHVGVRGTCLDANTLWSATFVGSELHSFVLGVTVICFSYWYMGKSSRERKFLGAKVPESENSM